MNKWLHLLLASILFLPCAQAALTQGDVKASYPLEEWHSNLPTDSSGQVRALITFDVKRKSSEIRSNTLQDFTVLLGYSPSLENYRTGITFAKYLTGGTKDNTLAQVHDINTSSTVLSHSAPFPLDKNSDETISCWVAYDRNRIVAGYNEPGTNMIADYQDTQANQVKILGTDRKILSFRANTFYGDEFNELNISNVTVKELNLDLSKAISLHTKKTSDKLALQPNLSDLLIRFNAQATEDFSLTISKQVIDLKHHKLLNTATPYWLTFKKVTSGPNIGWYQTTAGLGSHPGSNIIYNKVLEILRIPTEIEINIGAGNKPLFLSNIRTEPLTQNDTKLFGLEASRFSNEGEEAPTPTDSMVAAPNDLALNWIKEWTFPEDGIISWRLASPNTGKDKVLTGLKLYLHNITNVDGHLEDYAYCVKIDTNGRGATGLYSAENELLSDASTRAFLSIPDDLENASYWCSLKDSKLTIGIGTNPGSNELFSVVNNDLANITHFTFGSIKEPIGVYAITTNGSISGGTATEQKTTAGTQASWHKDHVAPTADEFVVQGTLVNSSPAKNNPIAIIKLASEEQAAAGTATYSVIISFDKSTSKYSCTLDKAGNKFGSKEITAPATGWHTGQETPYWLYYNHGAFMFGFSETIGLDPVWFYVDQTAPTDINRIGFTNKDSDIAYTNIAIANATLAVKYEQITEEERKANPRKKVYCALHETNKGIVTFNASNTSDYRYLLLYNLTGDNQVYYNRIDRPDGHHSLLSVKNGLIYRENHEPNTDGNYWFAFDNGKIALGHGTTPGVNTKMAWNNTNTQDDVRFIGLSCYLKEADFSNIKSKPLGSFDLDNVITTFQPPVGLSQTGDGIWTARALSYQPPYKDSSKEWSHAWHAPADNFTFAWQIDNDSGTGTVMLGASAIGHPLYDTRITDSMVTINQYDSAGNVSELIKADQPADSTTVKGDYQLTFKDKTISLVKKVAENFVPIAQYSVSEQITDLTFSSYPTTMSYRNISCVPSSVPVEVGTYTEKDPIPSPTQSPATAYTWPTPISSPHFSLAFETNSSDDIFVGLHNKGDNSAVKDLGFGYELIINGHGPNKQSAIRRRDKSKPAGNYIYAYGPTQTPRFSDKPMLWRIDVHEGTFTVLYKEKASSQNFAQLFTATDADFAQEIAAYTHAGTRGNPQNVTVTSIDKDTSPIEIKENKENKEELVIVSGTQSLANYGKTAETSGPREIVSFRYGYPALPTDYQWKPTALRMPGDPSKGFAVNAKFQIGQGTGDIFIGLGSHSVTRKKDPLQISANESGLNDAAYHVQLSIAAEHMYVTLHQTGPDSTGISNILAVSEKIPLSVRTGEHDLWLVVRQQTSPTEPLIALGIDSPVNSTPLWSWPTDLSKTKYHDNTVDSLYAFNLERYIPPDSGQITRVGLATWRTDAVFNDVGITTIPAATDSNGEVVTTTTPPEASKIPSADFLPEKNVFDWDNGLFRDEFNADGGGILTTNITFEKPNSFAVIGLRSNNQTTTPDYRIVLKSTLSSQTSGAYLKKGNVSLYGENITVAGRDLLPDILSKLSPSLGEQPTPRLFWLIYQPAGNEHTFYLGIKPLDADASWRPIVENALWKYSEEKNTPNLTQFCFSKELGDVGFGQTYLQPTELSDSQYKEIAHKVFLKQRGTLQETIDLPLPSAWIRPEGIKPLSLDDGKIVRFTASGTSGSRIAFAFSKKPDGSDPAFSVVINNDGAHVYDKNGQLQVSAGTPENIKLDATEKMYWFNLLDSAFGMGVTKKVEINGDEDLVDYNLMPWLDELFNTNNNIDWYYAIGKTADTIMSPPIRKPIPGTKAAISHKFRVDRAS